MILSRVGNRIVAVSRDIGYTGYETFVLSKQSYDNEVVRGRLHTGHTVVIVPDTPNPHSSANYAAEKSYREFWRAEHVYWGEPPGHLIVVQPVIEC